jgi:hypothetical protein
MAAPSNSTSASFFRKAERLAFVSSSLGLVVEVLGVALGVAALIVALALRDLPPDAPFWGLELLGLGAGFGAVAGLCWWLERRPSRRDALRRVDDWFELDGALVTAWELECGAVTAPSFQAGLAARVSRVLADKKEIGRAAFALTLPILMVPLAGAAVLAGVQEERLEEARLLETQAAERGGGAGTDSGASAPLVGAPPEQEQPALGSKDLGDLDDPDAALAAEIADLEAMQKQLADAQPASNPDDKKSLSPGAKDKLQERIAERIAELEAIASGENKPDEASPDGDEGSNPGNGPGNGSNEGTERPSGVTGGADQGRISAFQGISPTGAWWPERQDEIVRSWLLRLEGTEPAAE